MELKRIIARDTRAANEKAIQLYGEDVLIISTQRVDNQTELIVAVDVRPDLPERRAAASDRTVPPATPTAPALRAEEFPASAGASAPAVARVLEPAAAAPFVSFSDWFEGAMAPQSAPAAVPAQADAASARLSPPATPELPVHPAETRQAMPAAVAFAAARQSAATGQAASQDQDACVVDQADPATNEMGSAAPALTDKPAQRKRTRRNIPAVEVQSMPPSSAATGQAQAHDLRRSQEIVDLLRQEMAALRQEFALSRQLGPLQDLRQRSPAVQQLALGLQDLGVPATLRTLLLDGVAEHDSLSQALAQIRQSLERSLTRDAAGPVQPMRGVHALWGPTGAGKSSMVARLACAAAGQWGAPQVAIVSLADHRPGAWAQLQVLAAQAGVDCFRASDLATLELLLEDLQPRSAVFIDTAGTDFLQQAAVLAARLPAVQRHAVLPVDATVTSVQKIFQSNGHAWSCLMLSKMDEAAHPWPLIKALCDHPLPVGAVALSERITTPVQAFDPAGLATLAMAALPDQTPTVSQPVPAAGPVPRRRRARPATSHRTATHQEQHHVQ